MLQGEIKNKKTIYSFMNKLKNKKKLIKWGKSYIQIDNVKLKKIERESMRQKKRAMTQVNQRLNSGM